MNVRNLEQSHTPLAIANEYDYTRRAIGWYMGHTAIAQYYSELLNPHNEPSGSVFINFLAQYKQATQPELISYDEIADDPTVILALDSIDSDRSSKEQVTAAMEHKTRLALLPVGLLLHDPQTTPESERLIHLRIGDTVKLALDVARAAGHVPTVERTNGHYHELFCACHTHPAECPRLQLKELLTTHLDVPESGDADERRKNQIRTDLHGGVKAAIASELIAPEKAYPLIKSIYADRN